MSECAHEKTIETLRESGPHYSDIRCAACGKHMGFGRNPKTIERHNRQAAAIVMLRSNARLTEWERGFIKTMDESGPKISPKQIEVLDKIIARYLT